MAGKNYTYKLIGNAPKKMWGMHSDHLIYDFEVYDGAAKLPNGVAVSVSVIDPGTGLARTAAEIEAYVKEKADAQLLGDLKAEKNPSANTAPNPDALKQFTGQSVDPDKAVGPMGEALPK